MELPDPTQVDRGRAWIVLFASFMSLFLSCGALYSVSVFNLIFLEEFGASKAATSISGAVLIGLIAMMGPLSGLLTNKLGWRTTVVLGGIIATAGTFLASTSKNILELLLYYGIISGIGHGLVYTAAIVVVGYYFERYRTLASGIASVGAGVGMMVFPPMVQYFYRIFAWRELMIYISCFYAHLCVFGMLMASTSDQTSSHRRDTVRVIEIDRNVEKVVEDDRKQFYDALPSDESTKLSPVSEHCDRLQVEVQLLSENGEDKNPEKFEIPSSDAQNGVGNGMPGVPYDANGNSVHNECVKTQNGSKRSFSLSANASSVRCVCRQIGQYFGTCCGYSCRCSDDGSTVSNAKKCTASELLTKKFAIFCFSIFVFGLGLSALYLHLSAFATSKGASETEASFLITVLGISSIISRIFTGFAGNDNSVDNTILYIGAFGVAGIATIACPAIGNTYHGRLAFTIIFGFYGSCFNVLLAPLTVELIGLQNLTTAFGIEMVINGIAYFLGPPLAGFLYDCFLSYDTSFFLAGTSLILSSLVMMLVSLDDKPLTKS